MNGSDLILILDELKRINGSLKEIRDNLEFLNEGLDILVEEHGGETLRKIEEAGKKEAKEVEGMVNEG